MTSSLALLLAAVLGAPLPPKTEAAAPPPAASSQRTRVGLTFDVLWHRDRGYDAFSADGGSNAIGLAASYDILPQGRRCILSGGAGWQYEGATARLGQTADTALASHAFYVSAAARLPLLAWIGPQARVAAGAARSRVKIDPVGAPVLAGSAWSGFASAGMGLTIHTPRGVFSAGPYSPDPFQLSFDIEGGWMLSTAFDLAVRPTGLTESAVARSPIPLGGMDPSGPYLRVMFGVVL